MEHQYYPKIETTFKKDFPSFPKWVATEKVHGAQFVAATDGRKTRFGKRKAWLKDSDNFFGWQVVKNDLQRAALSLFENLSPARQIYIYGELCGGHYPHEDVKNNQVFSPVQTGIWYSPELEYIVFDIMVEDLEDQSCFLSFSDMEKAVRDCTSLKTAPVLAKGSYESLQSLPVRFESRVYKLFDLPRLPDNIAEGYVLKPDEALPPDSRPVIKKKIPEFSENEFDQSRIFNSRAMAAFDDLLDLLPRMVNQHRKDSARSKVGDCKDAIREEMILDVLVDLDNLLPLKMASLTAQEEAVLNETLRNAVGRILQS